MNIHNSIRSRLFTVFVMLSFSAYPAVAVATFIFNVESSFWSITVRTLIFFLALVLISTSKLGNNPSSQKILLLAMLLFWSCYITRMTFDTLLSSKFLFRDPQEYWIWAIGGSFIPMIAFARQDPKNLNWGKIYFWIYFWFLLAGVFLCVFASQTVTVAGYGSYDSGRLSLPSLNPIALGHVGTSILLLAMHGLLNLKLSTLKRILASVPGILIGGYLMIASNSRGPLFATIGCFIFLLLAVKGKKKGTIALFSTVGILTFIPIAVYLENTYKISTYSRLFNQNFFEEENVASRSAKYVVAMSDFSLSPFLGRGLEPSDGSAYPHNIVVESFLSMGIFPGFAIIVFISLFALQCRRYYREFPEVGWVCLLYVQFVIAAQFSGALYDSTYLWSVIGMVISLSGIRSPVKNDRSNFKLPRPKTFSESRLAAKGNAQQTMPKRF
jgi:hypothetical protein